MSDKQETATSEGIVGQSVSNGGLERRQPRLRKAEGMNWNELSREVARETGCDPDGGFSQDGQHPWVVATVRIATMKERDACARMLELRDSELLLMAGEMTAQELRTVKAVLAQRASAIRMRSNTNSA